MGFVKGGDCMFGIRYRQGCERLLINDYLSQIFEGDVRVTVVTSSILKSYEVWEISPAHAKREI